MSTKPTVLPVWATSPASGGVVVPSSAKQQRGFVAGERPPAQYLNWILVNVYLWLQWVSDGDVSFNSLTVAHNITLGTNATDTLTINSTVTMNNQLTLASLVVNAGATFNGNVALGDSGGDALTVNATGTFQAACTFNGSITTAGNFNANGTNTLNGNTTIGASGSNTLTVNASTTCAGSFQTNGTSFLAGNSTIGNTSANTTTINATSTFNANATIASGKTLTLPSASALKGFNRTKMLALNPKWWDNSSGSVTSGAPGSILSASFSGLHPLLIDGQETLTSLVIYLLGNGANVLSVGLWFLDTTTMSSGAITGLTFSAGGATNTTYTMSGTPSIALTPNSRYAFYLLVNTTAGGTAQFSCAAMGLST